MANLLAKALDGEEGIHLGAVRPSMIQNELLLKAPMGTARRRGHPLPQGWKGEITIVLFFSHENNGNNFRTRQRNSDWYRPQLFSISEPFVYGRPYPDDDGGVAECMHKWNVVRREDITARLQVCFSWQGQPTSNLWFERLKISFLAFAKEIQVTPKIQTNPKSTSEL